jgi:hypothetical protein
MTDLVYDLVMFARYMLVPGGRLVFFLPTVTEDWDDLDVPTIEGMEEIKFCSGSSQDFGRWSRRVRTAPCSAERQEPANNPPLRFYAFPRLSLSRWKRPARNPTLDRISYPSIYPGTNSQVIIISGIGSLLGSRHWIQRRVRRVRRWKDKIREGRMGRSGGRRGHTCVRACMTSVFGIYMRLLQLAF